MSSHCDLHPWQLAVHVSYCLVVFNRSPLTFFYDVRSSFMAVITEEYRLYNWFGGMRE